MKELEDVHCEIRRVRDLQFSIPDQLHNSEGENYGPSDTSNGYNSLNYQRGGFLNDTSYAWLCCGARLVVVNVKTGERISSWNFSERISCVVPFTTQSTDLPLLLVGLDNNANKIKDSIGLLCIFNCTTSKVLRAIRLPVGVEQVCIVSGGENWEEFNHKKPNNVLNGMSEVACVALRNLHHIMIDLQRSSWDEYNCDLIADEMSPAEICFSTAKSSVADSGHEKHRAYHLFDNRIERHIGFNREKFERAGFCDEKLTSVLISSTKIGCLISGCLGRVIIWQNDGSIGWISPQVDGNMIVTHLALLEPTDDPRPFYYLWVVYEEELSNTPPILRMYALLFERKYCEKGTNLYFNLEAEPSPKFELVLDKDDKIVSLSTIEREINPEQTDTVNKRGDDSLLLISTTNRAFLFDLNQWYKEQMPRSLEECQNPNSILACYNMKPDQNIKRQHVLSCNYVPSTLRDFPRNCPTLTEELFYPNSLSLEWVELSLTNLTFWMTRGIQVELLRSIATAGPVILMQPSQTFHKCLSVGLVPFNTDFSFTSDQNAQREMLLSVCLEQRWTAFLVRCVKEWSDGSAAYLYPSFHKWGVHRASSIKMMADRLCIPFFDQSGSSIGETEVKTLRFYSQQLECLSSVVSQIPLDSSDLIKQRKALKRVSAYLQVLLWFYDVGLLPETQELEEGGFQISLALKIPYPVNKLSMMYKQKRERINKTKYNHNEATETLFIDELITRECPALKVQWEREGADGNASSYYPPPSLQSLLRSFLTECHQSEEHEFACKHQVTIYLLMDLAMLLQGSYPSVDQLIKYPSAFKISPSLIKLTQAFWFLDNEDYQGFLDMMTGQLISDFDVKDWHHKHVLRTLIQSNQHKLALTYLRVRKPPLTSIADQGTVISLSVEHRLVQSAFHRRPPSHYAQLLTCFFQACKVSGKLNDILHLALDAEEEEVFVRFLEDNDLKDMRLLYYLQRCRYTEARNGNIFTQSKNNLQKDIQPATVAMLNAYSATLPNVMKSFSVDMAKTNFDGDVESRYPRPMSHCKSYNKMLKIHEGAVKKARETFISTDRCQIPFVSAPCASLKFSDNTNTNCVLFPTLSCTNRAKRTIDQIYDTEDGRNGTPEGMKRRKLSESSNVNETLNIIFSTPLVKRKDYIHSENSPTETPHSILKIRQLIRDSTPANTRTPRTSEGSDGLLCEQEKKSSRQIRFSIHQSVINNNNTRATDSEEETDRKSDTFHENEEIFHSPERNTESHNESQLLSDGSYTGKNIYCPRPRPSLRRSHLKTSKESLNQSLDKTMEDSTVMLCNPYDVSGEEPMNMESSVHSAAGYSSGVLSADSSFERTLPSKKTEDIFTMLQSKSICERNNKDGNSVRDNSIAPSQDTEVEAVDNASEMSSADGAYMEVQSNASFSEEFTNRIESSRDNEASETHKRRYGTHNDLSHNKFDTSEYKDVDEQDTNILDESDKGLPCLNADEKEDNEETFESLSNSVDNDSARLLSGKLTSKHNGHNTQESNRLLAADFDMTDDESSNSVETVALVLDEPESEEKHSLDPVAADVDITDDESDSSVNPNKRLTKREEQLHDGISVDDKLNAVENTVTEYESHRVTRSRRASSVNIEVVDTYSRTSVIEKVRRSRRAGSLVQDAARTPDKATELSETPVVERTRRSRRASSLANDLLSTPIKTTEGSSVSTPTRRRRVSSVRGDDRQAEENNADRIKSSGSGSRGAAVQKVTRSRKPSSSTIDVLDASIESTRERTESVPTKKGAVQDGLKAKRSRRGSSAAKDEPARTDDPVPSGERSTTAQRKTTPVKQRVEEAKPETPARRSTRRAASVQKELASRKELPSAVPAARRARASSVSSVVSEDGDDNPLEGQKQASRKRATRTRGGSVARELNESMASVMEDEEQPVVESEKQPEHEQSAKKRKRRTSESKDSKDSKNSKDSKDSKAPARARRASSVDQDAARVRRASSVDQDAARVRRASSVDQDAARVADATIESRKRRSSISASVDVIGSPAANTRSRRVSIQSIPEELEEVLSASPRRGADNGKKEEARTRERRAASAEPQLKAKRRARNARAGSIVREAIVEEPAEAEEAATTSRKRTASVSSATRMDSAREESPVASTTSYVFSQPEQTGHPAGQKQK